MRLHLFQRQENIRSNLNSRNFSAKSARVPTFNNPWLTSELRNGLNSNLCPTGARESTSNIMLSPIRRNIPHFPPKGQSDIRGVFRQAGPEESTTTFTPSQGFSPSIPLHSTKIGRQRFIFRSRKPFDGGGQSRYLTRRSEKNTIAARQLQKASCSKEA